MFGGLIKTYHEAIIITEMGDKQEKVIYQNRQIQKALSIKLNIFQQSYMQVKRRRSLQEQNEVQNVDLEQKKEINNNFNRSRSGSNQSQSSNSSSARQRREELERIKRQEREADSDLIISSLKKAYPKLDSKINDAQQSFIGSNRFEFASLWEFLKF